MSEQCKYVLLYMNRAIMTSESIVGVFDSGKELKDAVTEINERHHQGCLVKTIPANLLAGNFLAGFDYQGTMLNEWLACPIANDDTGE